MLIPEYNRGQIINHIFINQNFVLIAERAILPLSAANPPDLMSMIHALTFLPVWAFNWNDKTALAFLPFKQVSEETNTTRIDLTEGTFIYCDGQVVQLNETGKAVGVARYADQMEYHNLSAKHYDRPETPDDLKKMFLSFVGPTKHINELHFIAKTFGDHAYYNHNLLFQRIVLLDRHTQQFIDVLPGGFIEPGDKPGLWPIAPMQ